MNQVEVDLHRANTKAFINERPTDLTLTPYTKERTAAGGYREIAGTPRSPQTFRIIETGGGRTTPDATIVRTTDGTQRTVNYWLLGEWNAQIAVNDRWEEGGKEWEVKDILRPNEYEQRAVVVERG